MYLTISGYWLGVLAGTVLPLVTALVSARVASPGTKAVILLFLSAVAGWLTSLQVTGGVFEVRSALVGVVVTFASAVVAHYGLLKPIGLTGGSGVIARAVPGGVGGGGEHVAPVGTPASDPGPPPGQPY